jgi:predicted metal-binding protein
MVKRIELHHDHDQLQQDIKKYCQLSLDRGASAALPIPASLISVDERVRMKCRYPLCAVYGKCMNCPPHTGSVEDTRRQVKLFTYAIALKLDVASERVLGSAAVNEGAEDLRKLSEIISAVESAAFYDGYYFATGFSSATCMSVWCKGVECQALQGKGCRYQARVYASMEAVGIDVYRLAASVGWDIYPVGTKATADMFPLGSRCGLVLIE